MISEFFPNLNNSVIPLLNRPVERDNEVHGPLDDLNANLFCFFGRFHFGFFWLWFWGSFEL